MTQSTTVRNNASMNAGNVPAGNTTRKSARKNRSVADKISVESLGSIIVPTPAAPARELGNIQPKAETETDKALRRAKAQAEREARKQEREHQKALDNQLVAQTMTINDALRAICEHADEALEEGYTVGDHMAHLGLKKLDVKTFRSILPADFVRNGCICAPKVRAAVYDGGAAEDEDNGKPIYYYVVNGKGADAKKTYKKAQTYGFEVVKLWDVKVVINLLRKSLDWAKRAERNAKRNAEVKKAKHFYITNEVSENAVNGKDIKRATRTTTYVEVDAANVVWAE